MDPQEIADVIRKIITERHVPRSRLAKECGLSINALNSVENPVWNPTLSTLNKLHIYLIRKGYGAIPVYMSNWKATND